MRKDMYVPVFGEHRDKLFRKYKRSWLGAARVDGMQLGRGGVKDGLICGSKTFGSTVCHSEENVVIWGVAMLLMKKGDNVTLQKWSVLSKTRMGYYNSEKYGLKGMQHKMPTCA